MRDVVTIPSSTTALITCFIAFQERMSNSIEPDACVVQLDYKKAMLDINEGLGRRDIESLKFLCSDFIPVSRMERITSGLQIIQTLQQMCLISEPDNVRFFAELLLLIGRVDLLCKLKISADDVRSSLTDRQSRHVSDYRYVILLTLLPKLFTQISSFLSPL